MLDFQKNLLCSQACLNHTCSSRVLFVMEPLLTCGFFSSIELGCLKTQARVTQAEMRGVPQLCRAAVGTKEMSLVPCPLTLSAWHSWTLPRHSTLGSAGFRSSGMQQPLKSLYGWDLQLQGFQTPKFGSRDLKKLRSKEYTEQSNHQTVELSKSFVAV